VVGRGERGAWGRGKGVFDKTSSGERVEGEGNGGKGSGKRLLGGETWNGKKTGKITVYDPIRDLGTPLLLIMLDQAMRVHRVGHRAVEVEGDAGGAAVGGHEGRVFLHAVLGGIVFGVLVPLVFVFAFVAGVGVELVGEEFDGEGDVFGGGEGLELVEG